MAFQNKNLSVIAYANGWTYWVYRDFESAIILSKEYIQSNELDYLGWYMLFLSENNYYLLNFFFLGLWVYSLC